MQSKNVIRLYVYELESMREYSTSLPTGTTLFKMWKRNLNTHSEPEWWVGMYVRDPDPKYVRIMWFKVHLRHGPVPPDWRAPDWDNYKRFNREWEQERAAAKAQYHGHG